ncbi:MAG: HAD-IA family hydrolase [Spirochaetales bacterium]|nr:HAD-IA family hydrolase [Spirochaetales bacterium]
MLFLFSDLDGTLEDSRADMADSVLLARQEFDLQPGVREEWIPFVNRGMDQLYESCFSEILAKDSSLATREKIRLTYESIYHTYIAEETVLYPGIETMLSTLENHAVMALYTNKPQELSRRLLHELKISRYFQYIIGGDTFPESKPSPGPMQTITAEAGFDPQKDICFYLGDTASDKLAADAFGAHFIWAAWGYEKTAPEGTRYSATDPARAQEIILSLGSVN